MMVNEIRKGYIRSGVAMIAIMTAMTGIGASGTAFAQAPDAQDASVDTAGGEIVVTARKRQESMQDVPVSITAYGAEDLAKVGATNVEQTIGVTPGLAVTVNGLSPARDFRQLVIRGIGANSQLEPSTATFIDGVYSPGLSFDSDLLEVERVEILKGPQGTLFGRNTEGGAVNIVLRRPDATTRGRVDVAYESFDTAKASASLSGPIAGDTLFGSIALSMTQSDYFVKQNGSAQVGENPFWPGRDLEQEYNAGNTNIKSADGQRSLSGRAALRFVPTDTLEFNLSGHYSSFKGVDQAPGPLSTCHCYTVDGDQAFQNTSKNYGIALNVEKTFDAMTLNLIGGYEFADSSAPFDFDGTATRVNNYHDFDRTQKSASVELRLQSNPGGPLQWLAGLYAFHDYQYNSRWYNFSNMDDPAGAAPQSSYDGLWNQQLAVLKRDGVAGFGQVSYEITPQLEATVGARYSYEKVKVSALERFEFPVNGVIRAYTPSTAYGWADFVTPVKNSEGFNNFSPSASLRYKITPQLTTYATVSRGFKGGSFQVAPVQPSDVVPINPETTTNYEIGLKGSLFDRLVSFNLAGYHIDIKDQQLQSSVIRGNFVATTINNASSSKVDGFEFDMTVRPTSRLTLSGNVAYTRGRFTNYLVSPGDRNGDGVVNQADQVDKSGDPFPYVPEWTYYLSADYRIPAGSGDVVLGANFRHVASTTVGSGATSSDPVYPLPGWDRLDLSIGWENANWKIRAYMQNATDEYIILSRWKSFQVQPNAAFWHDRVDAPRRTGISVGYRF
ncbi:TonB-dependent receptor [Sphingobium sp. YR768]|uniref:TonB-dependent receptor n=1 Tax=Sphingobium sp. YR768 TaxID=1884365 RepID=UPI0008AEBC37|nr:TonB-dependent receptor [Sphingobium sp. YR768]SER26071.1 iron complex outermembrane recepter protein [Sphingobium sp. YR768]